MHIRDLDGVFEPLFLERNVSANHNGFADMLILLIIFSIAYFDPASESREERKIREESENGEVKPAI